MFCTLLCSVVDFIARLHRKPFTYTHILGRTVLSDKCLSGGNHSKAIITKILWKTTFLIYSVVSGYFHSISLIPDLSCHCSYGAPMHWSGDCNRACISHVTRMSLSTKNDTVKVFV